MSEQQSQMESTRTKDWNVSLLSEGGQTESNGIGGWNLSIPLLLDGSSQTLSAQAIIFGPILVILIISGIVGNLFTIVTIVCIRRLRTLPNYLSINLAISDLVTAAFVNSLLLKNIIINKQLEIGSFACDLTGYASSVTPITSLLILCTIALQRYCASSQNAKVKAVNKNKFKMAFDISFPWITATLFDLILNKVINEGHIWDRRIYMCIYVHTDWRVSMTHFVVLVMCTLLLFGSHWSLSRATYRWKSIQDYKSSTTNLFTKRTSRNSEQNGVPKNNRSSFYISVAGRTVSLESYQAFKVRSSVRRTLLLILVFVFTCFPWYSLALINSLWPLGDAVPSAVWLTAAVLEHANCSLNFFINNAANQRYRKFVARNMPLPSIITQKLARASRTAIQLKEMRKPSSASLTGRAGLHRPSVEITDEEISSLKGTRSTPMANGKHTVANGSTSNAEASIGPIFEIEENETVFVQI